MEVECGSGSFRQKIRILGLGGSMRYRDNAPDMYTEREMEARVKRAERTIRKLRNKDRIMSLVRPSEKAGDEKKKADFDILLTHAPCRGYGDLEDLPHMGFECFNYLLNKYSPQLHCYGHVHREYGRIERRISHPSGTLLINGSGHQIIDFGTP